MTADDALVLGLDVGGTASRAVVVTLDGRLAGHGRAGGGNPASRPPEVAAASVATAIRIALSTADPGAVRAGVLGVAGFTRMAEPRVADSFEHAWRGAGLRCPMSVVADLSVVYVAATPAPSGTVLVAGTGAVAGRVDDRMLTRIAGGLGWLLGDEGSGFWLGRAAAREVARALSAGQSLGLLGRLVTRRLLGDEPPTEPARALVAEVYRRRPAELAALAPLVSEAAAAGDPTARAIVRDAVRWLTGTLAEVRDDAARTPIVLGGSVLTSTGPIQNAVRRTLARRWNAPVLVTTTAAVGAAWLAARTVTDLDEQEAAALHDRLRVATAAIE
ncbi:ATPase [Planosporangium flavigriseum]|uniref:N-acetylglucosamine kinase n=1 Tax=Planosporangium flavigriseum TaxID=373681 RepID=A0A8J3LY53_9ACTN|nr:BadF/BadG/BcrA/BcrD ATPase family protein [Planosporangium flavigriseum]NJC67611.1 ATPase [Planosporangium flavigriseum]GIG75681.1 N-acetylglucosamine kinase [Planosporangium flavigriseum]